MTAHLPLVALSLLLQGAANDNNVEWSGVSHHHQYDRSPMCPVGGESFTVSVHTWDFDITSVRVNVDDGSGGTWIAAAFSHDRESYDVWSATIPASSPTGTIEYYFELTDGTDTDYLGPTGMRETTPPAIGWVVNFTTLSHAGLGATATTDGGAVFRVWAPNATTANLAGQFNGWSMTATPMTKSGGVFMAKHPTVSTGQMYKYIFNGTNWKTDARARGLNPGDNYNSHVYAPSTYAWNDGGFQTPAFEDMILYELHIGTFSGRNDGGVNPGTYRQAADLHVGHLVDLGVNAVELMPITEFPWDYSGGYNPITAWAPERKWGNPDDLKYLIDTLHQNGIAVLLDIVWNHFSPTDNYLWTYDGTQIYFDTPQCDTPWGSQAALWKQEVRDYYLDSVAYWFEEFHLDGFRMDATSYMRDPLGCYPAGWTLMQELNDIIDSRYADKISTAEELPDDTWVTRSTATGGAGFDAQWHDIFVDNLRAAIFAMAGGNPNVSAVAYGFRGSIFAGATAQVINYTELHDEAWPDNGGQRMIATIDPTLPHDDVFAKGRHKLAHGLVMFSAGIPAILQGAEFLESTPFGANAPGTYEARLDWTKPTTYAGIFQYFKDIIRIRKTNGGLRSNAACDTYHVNDSAGIEVMAAHRFDLSGNDLVIVANFSNNNHSNYQLGFPQAGTWYEILNSQAAAYDGNGLGNGGSITTSAVPADGFADSASITIPQMGLLLFRHNVPPEPPGSGDFDQDGDTDLTDFAVFQECYIGASCPGFADADLDNDGDVDSADYAQFASNLTGP